jgi:acetyl esterase
VRSPSILAAAEGAAVGLVAALPPSVALALSGRPQVRIDGQELEPGLQLVLRLMALRGAASLIAPGATSAERERARVRRDALALAARRTAVAAVDELTVDGARGPIRARHYAPDPQGGPHPLLVFAHGGGWVVGDLDTHDEPCRLVCRHGSVHVLSLDYALAPEHPFPAGLEDVVAAARWAVDHAAELGADPQRVAIGGDSAGGNLAAVAATTLVREHGIRLAGQILIYPSTDQAAERESSRLFGAGLYLTTESRTWCQDHYMPPGTDRSDPRLSPLRAENLSGLPPAIVVTAAFDPLRDEGEAYAAALQAAGNRVVLVRVPGMIHGFVNMTAVNRAARDATLELCGMIRAELARP